MKREFIAIQLMLAFTNSNGGLVTRKRKPEEIKLRRLFGKIGSSIFGMGDRYDSNIMIHKSNIFSKSKMTIFGI